VKRLISVAKLNPNKNVIRIPRIRNGAKGISVLKPTFFLEKAIIISPTIAPIQKAIIIAKDPEDIPSIQPIPIISLTSPNPISLPLDKSQMIAKGRAIITPEKTSSKVSQLNVLPKTRRFTNMHKNDRAIKGKANLFGIILCLKS